MKTSGGKVKIGAIAAVSVVALVVMATIALPGRQPQQSVSAEPIARSRSTQPGDGSQRITLASNADTPPQGLEPLSGQVIPPPPRPFAIPPGAPIESEPAIPPPASQPETSGPGATSGIWTALNDQPFNHIPTFYPASVSLLTDGTILAQDGELTDVAWWKLTPDNTGSYINGTWSQVASPPNCPNGYSGESQDTIYSPQYYGSAVLPDGRFVAIGGEYDYNYAYVPNHGSEVWTNQGAIYDPVADTWTCIAAPTGWSQIGDAESVVLPDGTFLIADPLSSQVATLNVSTNPPTFNPPFTPSGKSADGNGYNN